MDQLSNLCDKVIISSGEEDDMTSPTIYVSAIYVSSYCYIFYVSSYWYSMQLHLR